MQILGIDLLPVLVAAIVFYAIGALWYSPQLFGKKWMELTRTTPEECKCDWKTYLGAFVVALVFSFIFAHFIHALHATTALEGAKIGFVAWLGFNATLHFSAVIWERVSIPLYLIHVGNSLLGFIAVGAILAAWS
jgi:Protein of unknown function (DUF1761)